LETEGACGWRQTSNSLRRLKGTFVDKVDADNGVGGAANSTDLVCTCTLTLHLPRTRCCSLMHLARHVLGLSIWHVAAL